MSPSGPDPAPPRAPLPLGLFALANIGGVIAYLPLLTLLVPLKVEAISADGRIALLSLIAVAGAVVASGANILFGWLSDRSRRAGGGRRGWMAIGLVGIAASYAAIGMASTSATLVAAILGFQFAVNALLAPLMAIMAEEIPDAKRGLAGGLLALGNPAASALSAWLVGEAMLGERARLAMVLLVILLCVLPLVLTRGRLAVAMDDLPVVSSRPPRRDFWIAGLSRLLIQVAAVATQFYLLYYFETIVPSAEQADLPRWIGQLFTFAFIVPLPLALIFGRLADRAERRQYVLLLAALVAALGLFAMALAQSRAAGAAAFILYTAGSSVFVALHSGLSFQLLPDPRHRGRDLGLFNLTNTLPTFLGAALTWTFATPQDFGRVLIALAMVTIAGGLAILGVRAWR
ncbi:MFS transporter [Sphingomonas fuzhouensis]|uniref:MFS transporter n=1 Tax=Sphingomonas fuzhouensis TaxID=3106033 RepID=UPI002AFEB2D8|nr:MFS transporter [Sphingomonas sp. SGZ-02]